MVKKDNYTLKHLFSGLFCIGLLLLFSSGIFLPTYNSEWTRIGFYFISPLSFAGVIIIAFNFVKFSKFIGDPN